MKTVADEVDPSIQRWPISYLLEEYFVAARRHFGQPNPRHRAVLVLCRIHVREELARSGPPRARDFRAAWRLAAERRADDSRFQRCQCWRCGAVRRCRLRR